MDQKVIALAPLPRVTIEFCTQCKWMLRAAYFAQELLSTFSDTLGEVALQPSTSGTFIVSVYTSPPSASAVGDLEVQHDVLWDRKVEGGFPEVKELKRRLRDIIEPGRGLGHVDGTESNVPLNPIVTGEPSHPISETSEGNTGQPNFDAERARENTLLAISNYCGIKKALEEWPATKAMLIADTKEQYE